MKNSYKWIALTFGTLVFLGLPVHTLAAWPMNTPESQWNPIWAGENMVWNDDRLGSPDIFIRASDAAIKPLISSSDPEILLAASDKNVIFKQVHTQETTLYAYNLAQKSLVHLNDGPDIVSASTWNGETAWSDGATLYWVHKGGVLTRPLANDRYILSASGVAWINGDAITIWNGGGDQSVSCNSCMSISNLDQDLLLQSRDGTIRSWPHNTINLEADSEPLVSSASSFLFWRAGKSYIWHSGNEHALQTSLPRDVQLSPSGFVRSNQSDLELHIDATPEVHVVNSSIGVNDSNVSLQTNTDSLELRVLKSGSSTITTLQPVSGKWSGKCLPAGASDGHYDIFITAVSQLGQRSKEISLGAVTIDHVPPTLTNEPSLDASIDTARIHFETNEKTDSRIVLSTAEDQEASVRTNRRLTFSHTTTIQDLDPDQLYDVAIEANDEGHNSLRFNRTFHTLSLLDGIVTVMSSGDAGPEVSGIWQGRLLVPPGIIRDDQAILELDGDHRLLLLDWTIGKPPPGLQMGDIVRVKGKIDGTTAKILLHRDKAIAKIGAGLLPVTVDVSDSTILSSHINSWIRITGELTSVAKQSWKVKVGDYIVPVKWVLSPEDHFKRGQIVTIEGFLLQQNDLVLAASSAKLVRDVTKAVKTSKKSTSKKASVVLASTRGTTLVDQGQLAFAPLAKKINHQTTEDTITSHDRLGEIWYTLALLLCSGVIGAIFFFRHRH